MLKKLIAALLFVCPLVFANWDGSVKKPAIREIDGKEFYEIATPENLAWFAVNVGKGNLDYNAILTNDIVVWEDSVGSETIEWTPIAYNDSSDTVGYKGIFDGNGHKISGVYVPPKKYDRSGFFAIIGRGGVVKNLTIENAWIQGLLKSNSITGGIVGYFYGDSIVNCEFHGTVKDVYVGGIAGWFEKPYIGSRRENGSYVPMYAGGTIRNSRNYGKVVALDFGGGIASAADNGGTIIGSENFGPVTGAYCGGILGNAEYLGSANAQGGDHIVIDSSVNHASVSTTAKYGSSGGIISVVLAGSTVHIRNTVNEGNVYSGLDSTGIVDTDSANGFVAGGFVSISEGVLTIENSENKGDVTRYGSKLRGCAGGFLGYVGTEGVYVSQPSKVTISGSVNRGHVEAYRLSGGFVGKQIRGTINITSSINEGKIGSDSALYVHNAGFIAYTDGSVVLDGVVNKRDLQGFYVGGLIAEAASTYKIYNSVNEGNIYPNGFYKYSDRDAYRLGGLIGYGSTSSNRLFNVVNRGNVYYNARNSAYIGGLVGHSRKDSVYNAFNYGRIDVAVDSALGDWNSSKGAFFFAGGILGTGSNSSVVSSANYADVNYVNKKSLKTKVRIAGVVGSGSNGSIAQTVNYGNVYAKIPVSAEEVVVAGVVTDSKKVNNCINEGRVELNGNDEITKAFVAGIAYSGTVTNNINKGSLIHFGALNDTLIAAIHPLSSKASGNYSIADSVVINGVMTSGVHVKGCDYVDRTKLGLSDADDSHVLATEEMQNEKFAWRMNTCDGTVENSGSWSQGGKNYPVFADESHFAIYRLIFRDSSKVIRVKTYTIDSSYTNMAGHIIDMPKDPDPSDADENLQFGYWGVKGEAVFSKSIIRSDDSLYAFYINRGTEPSAVSFEVDGVIVVAYAISGSSVTLTLPDAQRTGRSFLGWYDGETLVGNAGASKKFTTATTLVARYESLYYAVKFLDQGNVLQNDSLAYGSMPVFKGDKPSYSDYEFVGWTPELASVSGDVSYFSTYFNPHSSSSSVESSSSSVDYGADWIGDALEGHGNFIKNCHAQGWTLNPRYSEDRGNSKLVENNDEQVVLQLWSNYRENSLDRVQAKYPINMQKGHSYKIVGSGYVYENSSEHMYMGFMQESATSDVLYEYHFQMDRTFESDVYEYCDESQPASFYINGGARKGGFAIEYVFVEERKIHCPGMEEESSSSEMSSSSDESSSSVESNSSSGIESNSSSSAGGKMSSSSLTDSSSSEESSSSEAESSSSEETTVTWNANRPMFNLAVNGMTLTLSNTQGGVVRIFDALGHLVAKKLLSNAMTNITLRAPGNYIVRVNGISKTVTLK